jgi:hypothetical protein
MVLDGREATLNLIIVRGGRGSRQAFLDQKLRLRGSQEPCPPRIHVHLDYNCDSLTQRMQHLNRRILLWVEGRGQSAPYLTLLNMPIRR